MSTTTQSPAATLKSELFALDEMEEAAETYEELERIEAKREEVVAKYRAATAPRRNSSSRSIFTPVGKPKTRKGKAIKTKTVKPNKPARLPVSPDWTEPKLPVAGTDNSKTARALKEAKVLNKTSDKTPANQNVPNRTLCIGDNLDVMRGMNSETVDLVTLDPPFNSKRIYNAPLGSKAAKASFKDTWRMDDVKREWSELQKHENKALYHTVVGAGFTAGSAMQAYLCFMTPRLVECYRLLKPSGSIYLHCDDTADSYLRQIMDAIFGYENRVNSITWKRQHSNNAVTRSFGRIADTILFYVKNRSEAKFNLQYGELSDVEKAAYRNVDVNGRRYKCDNLTAPKGHGADDSRRFTWRGATPSSSRVWAYSEEVLERMLADGEIELGRYGRAKLGGLKRYLDENPGQKLQSIWSDVDPIGPKSAERQGWPTQKPLELLERIIRASSDEGDLVFDPFCGCATAMVAAERLGRRWIGCDIDREAINVTKDRLNDNAENNALLNDTVGRDVNVTFRHPVRTDI